MTEYRVSFDEIEDEVAKLILYKDDEFQEHLRYHIEELPDGAERDHLGGDFRPEFDEEETITALHYDEELSKRKREEAEEGVKRFKEKLEDS